MALENPLPSDRGPALFYQARDGVMYQLDRGVPDVPAADRPWMSRPELDLCLALLRFALDGLEAQVEAVRHG